MAPEEKEQWGSEKGQEPKLVLEVPKPGPALEVRRFPCTVTCIALTQLTSLWSSSLASLRGGCHTALTVIFLKLKSECDTSLLQKIPTALGTKSILFQVALKAGGKPQANPFPLSPHRLPLPLILQTGLSVLFQCTPPIHAQSAPTLACAFAHIYTLILKHFLPTFA